MAPDDTSAFGRHLESLTERYLDQLDGCIGALPTLLERYERGAEFRSTVGRIQGLESDCDATKREIGELVTAVDAESVGLRMTWVHLHADRVLELYARLDEVANAAEQFAEELAAIAPPRRAEPLSGLTEMAGFAASAMAELREVVVEFVRTLCRPAYEASITGSVTAIRALEGSADAVRNDVIGAAFDGDGDGAVVYRQLAVLLDATLDAMEDVTDQMHLMTGTEEWFEIELYPRTDRGVEQ